MICIRKTYVNDVYDWFGYHSMNANPDNVPTLNKVNKWINCKSVSKQIPLKTPLDSW